MTEFEREVYGGIIVVVAGGLLTAGFKSLRRAYLCLKDGQGAMLVASHEIALQIRGIEGRFSQGEQWMEMHHEADKTAFHAIDRRIDEVRELVLKT